MLKIRAMRHQPRVAQLAFACKTRSMQEESMPRNIENLKSRYHRSRLQEQYLSLKEQIAMMDSRLSLSPDEQLLVSSLKRQKLAMKDELARLG